MTKKFSLILLFVICISSSVFGENYDLLEQKYLPLFQQMELDAVTQLKTLIDEAYVEYHQKKEKGELTLPTLLSYIEKGRQLEKNIDNEFQDVFMEMKNEAEKLGIPYEKIIKYETRYLKSKRTSKLQILKNIAVEGGSIKFERDL